MYKERKRGREGGGGGCGEVGGGEEYALIVPAT